MSRSSSGLNIVRQLTRSVTEAHITLVQKAESLLYWLSVQVICYQIIVKIVGQSDAALHLVEFQRQAVGVRKEGKAAARQFINTNGLAGHRVFLQPLNSGQQVGHGEGEVAQAGSFRVAGARRRIAEREQLDDVLALHGQVQLIRVPFGPMGFG